MTLGILVNTDRHPQHLAGLACAALACGHEVSIFVMDDGVKLLCREEISGLALLKGVTMSYCELNAKQSGILPGSLPEEIGAGSQYDNAVMVHRSDRVIVL